jgi:peptidyl-prolyl cis-trans isomerase SurA
MYSPVPSSRPFPRFVSAVSLLALLCGSASCRQASAPSPAPVSADTWAVVDGQTITRDDVDKAFRRVSSANQTLSDEEALTARLSLLDDLVMEEILVARARASQIDVPDSDVDAAVAQAKKDLTDEAFQQELTRRNLTVPDMRAGLERELLAQKVIERDVMSRVTVTDQQVSDFFNANRAQFNLPEEAFHLAQIVVTPARDPQLANSSGDDAATPEMAAAKVKMLMERLQGGTPFADLAREFSEDPESAPRGGDLGLVPVSAVKQASPALRDAVLNVEPGRARVINQDGVYLIMFVVSREPAGQRDLSTSGVRDQITQTLRARKEQLLRTAYLMAARADADVVNYIARRVADAGGVPAAAAASESQ